MSPNDSLSPSSGSWALLTRHATRSQAAHLPARERIANGRARRAGGGMNERGGGIGAREAAVAPANGVLTICPH
ncbi:hypothetical protein K525DRAFT_275769 [Schizophyllum commune Loenen D]|nr:hypothetical protein K525DRAFT_275769 [Schizophyllum commune Loenen D]